MYRIHTNVWYAVHVSFFMVIIGFCVVRYENLTDLFPFFLFHVLNKTLHTIFYMLYKNNESYRQLWLIINVSFNTTYLFCCFKF